MTQSQEKQQIIGGAVIMALFLAGIFYLASTNQPPRVDAAAIDTQIAVRKSYELPKFWAKYAEECYNGSHEKN